MLEFNVWKAMNFKNILVFFFLLTSVMVFAQDDVNQTSATAKAEAEVTDPEMSQTIFYNESERRNQKGCSFIQNPWRDRKMKVTKYGYKLETQDEDEVVKVKNYKSGNTVISYYNDYETLKYKTKNDKATYKYSYINECKKVKVKKDKNGVTSVTNKTSLETAEVRSNAAQAINRGVRTCQNMGY